LNSLQNAGQNYFGDPGYMFHPENWERMAQPVSTFVDIFRGQATRWNPFGRDGHDFISVFTREYGKKDLAHLT
jgi:hypothetical protein